MADHGIPIQSQPWGTINSHLPLQPIRNNTAIAQVDFAQILQQEKNEVKFSQHALNRMQNRNLRLTDNDLLKLNDAVAKIAQKGAKESLVYLNDIALVVSVKNKMVITAMDGNSAKENIFTNIDSAVIL